MIHKYKYNDLNIILDVNSGAVHVVDNVAYAVAELFEENSALTENGALALLSQEAEGDVKEAYSELKSLMEQKLLFSPDIFAGAPPVKKDTIVKALCLHMAHDCNLKCKYCFAGEGEYHGARSLMPAETAKAALDFLVAHSGNRKNLEVDFFGGEPTLNFDAIQWVMSYGRALEKIHNKCYRFSLTTNAFNITDEMIDFSCENMANIVLSIDGRKSVNDAMRPDKGGKGSYDKILRNIKRFVDKRNGENYYVRGTFTRNNLDFSKDVMHLYELGFKQVSIEPVVAPSSADYSIRHEDIPTLFSEYDELVKVMLKNPDLNFFHFNIDLTGGSCVTKRLSGCGAGCEYMSVTPEGDLYPCHQFTGLSEFKIGTVHAVENSAIIDEFKKQNIYSKPECAKCWAKFYCSGGCSANSYYYGGGINSYYEIGCLLQKKRIECAIYLQIVKNNEL